jgi:hypothetical protein
MYDVRNFTDEETLLAQSLAGLCARQRPLILKGSVYDTSTTWYHQDLVVELAEA